MGRVEIYLSVLCVSADPVVSKMEGSQLTIEFLLQNGFDQPIIIEDKEGLGLRVPSDYFTVQDVEALVGKWTYRVVKEWTCVCDSKVYHVLDLYFI